jgi:hypothetical protein
MELWGNLKNSLKIMELFSGFLYLYYESENSQEGDGAI